MKNKGYILTESLVAITLVLTSLLGIFSLLSQSLSLNRIVTDRYVAAYLAGEGIEITKNIIDSNLINNRPWNSGLASGNYEADYKSLNLNITNNRKLFLDDNGLYNYDSGAPTRFSRLIKIEQLGAGNELKVNSIVKWIGRGEAQYEVNLEDRFFNWR